MFVHVSIYVVVYEHIQLCVVCVSTHICIYTSDNLSMKLKKKFYCYSITVVKLLTLINNLAKRNVRKLKAELSI